MKNSEQPINPIQQTEEWYEKNNPKELIGLTKREYFAGLAMQGMASSAFWAENFTDKGDYLQKAIEISIKASDELLKQLESNEK